MFPVAFASYCKWIYDLLYIFGDWNSLWGNLFITFFGFLGICKRTRRSVLIKSVEVVEMVQDQDQCGWKWHKPCDNWDMVQQWAKGEVTAMSINSVPSMHRCWLFQGQTSDFLSFWVLWALLYFHVCTKVNHHFLRCAVLHHTPKVYPKLSMCYLQQ